MAGNRFPQEDSAKPVITAAGLEAVGKLLHDSIHSESGGQSWGKRIEADGGNGSGGPGTKIFFFLVLNSQNA